MLFIAYIVIAIAALVMVYFGHLQGTSQFYTSILGATIVLYCVYLDFKKRREKKAEENKKNGKSVKKTQHSGKKSNTNIPCRHVRTANTWQQYIRQQRTLPKYWPALKHLHGMTYLETLFDVF